MVKKTIQITSEEVDSIRKVNVQIEKGFLELGQLRRDFNQREKILEAHIEIVESILQSKINELKNKYGLEDQEFVALDFKQCCFLKVEEKNGRA